MDRMLTFLLSCQEIRYVNQGGPLTQEHLYVVLWKQSSKAATTSEIAQVIRLKEV